MPTVKAAAVLDSIAERGIDLFARVPRDLEGSLRSGRAARSTDGGGTSWLKIKNPHYSQMLGAECSRAARQRVAPQCGA